MLRRQHRGFTIVELLIVIVIIGILAAITLVAYGGISQRAANSAIIDAASKSSRVVHAYIAANGALPATTGACITVDSGCATGGAYGANAGFNTNIATIGTIPKTVPINGSTHYGVIYYYNASRTVDGIARPVVLLYWLRGTAQNCGLSGLVADPNAASTTTATLPYTAANDSGSGKTLCAITVSS